MKVNESKGSVVVNDITSSYGRNDNNFYIEQINLGNLVYQNKKKPRMVNPSDLPKTEVDTTEYCFLRKIS